MRLDEWQKYIQAQFLEDDPEPKSQALLRVADATPPKSEGDKQQNQEKPEQEKPEQEEPVQKESDNEGNEKDSPESPSLLQQRLIQANRKQSLSFYPVALPAVTEPVWDNAIYLARTETDIDPNNAMTKEETGISPPLLVVTPPRGSDSSAIPAFSSTIDLNAEIPSFEGYLPASYRRTEEAKEEAKTSEANSDIAHSRQADEQTLPHDIETPETKVRPHRLPRTRLRQTQHSMPAHVPSGAPAGAIWAGIPKYAPLLLALERLDEEREVAQSSYKKPFQEKRRELIERLLDPILTLEDAARLLNVCPTTVRRYTNKGILTYYRKEPEASDRAEARSEKETRQRRFRLSDILTFLETQQTAIQLDLSREEQSADRTSRTLSGSAVNAASTSGPDDEIRSKREEED